MLYDSLKQSPPLNSVGRLNFKQRGRFGCRLCFRLQVRRLELLSTRLYACLPEDGRTAGFRNVLFV